MHSDLILSHKAQKEPQGWSASSTCRPWPLSLLLWVCKLREIKVFWELHWWLSGKESACNSGDLGSIPEPGRFPGEGNGSPLQYFCLENFMDGEPGGLQSTGSQRVGHDWARTYKGPLKFGYLHFQIIWQWFLSFFFFFFLWWPRASRDLGLYFMFYVFILNCTGSSLLHTHFLQLRQAGAMLQLWWEDFSCCWALAPGYTSFSRWGTWA